MADTPTRKRPKKRKKLNDDKTHDKAEQSLGGRKEYEDYLKEHEKRVRRLEREARGLHLEEPGDD